MEVSNTSEIELFKLFGSAHLPDSLPALFLTRFRMGEFDILNQIGISLNEVLHGEQEYQYEKQYWIKREYPFKIKYVTELESQVEKKTASHKLIFLTFLTEIILQSSGERLATSKTVMIVRRAIS